MSQRRAKPIGIHTIEISSEAQNAQWSQAEGNESPGHQNIGQSMNGNADQLTADEAESSVSTEGVVDEESIVAAVRAAQYNSLSELRELLDLGKVTVNTRDVEECTLLQWAAINNRKNVVAELLARGADVNAKGGHLKETALQWAVRQGALEAVVVLVEQGNADPHLMGTEGLNALQLAIQGRKSDVLLYLCAADQSLVDAPTGGSASMPNATPVMYLVTQWSKSHRHSHSHHDRVTQRKKWSDMLRSLLAFGADVFAQQKGTGDTALHIGVAVKYDHDASLISEELMSAARKSASSDGNGRSSISLLNMENNAGQTPKQLASKRSGTNVASAMWRETLATRVPGPLGFFAPVLQIFSGFTAVAQLGWMLGCAAFAVACTGLSFASSATRATERHIQHGFASGSIFFIVVSMFMYMVQDVSSPFLVWYIFSVGMLVFFFVKTTTSDPGYVQTPRAAAAAAATASFSSSPSKSSTAAAALVDDLESSVMSTPLLDGVGANETGISAAKLIRRLAVKGDLHSSLLCSTCLVERPLRSKHCPTCSRCVHRFDHHCPFVNTCVGRDNIGYFIGFTTFCTIAIGSHLLVALPYIYGLCDNDRVLRHVKKAHQLHQSGYLMSTIANSEQFLCGFRAAPNDLVTITILALVHFLWISFLGCAQLNQIFSDVTTYEAIRGVQPKPVTCKQGCSNILSVIRSRPGTSSEKEHEDALFPCSSTEK